MRCHKYQQLIVLHLYGEIADKTKHRLEQHLQQCASCQREFEQMRAVVDRTAQRQVLTPSQRAIDIVQHAADIAVKDRTLHQYGVLWNHKWYGPRIGVAAAVFAVVALVASGLVVKVGWRSAVVPNEPIPRTVWSDTLAPPTVPREYTDAGPGETPSPGSFDAHLASLEADALYMEHQMAGDMAPLLDRHVQSVAHAVFALERELQ